MKIIIQGESIDLPMMLARLSEMAAVSGQSLKGFIEGVLEGKATEDNNPSRILEQAHNKKNRQNRIQYKRYGSAC